MSLYAAQGTQTAAAKTALVVISASTIRPRLVEFKYSNVGTVSTDSGFQMQLKRCTTTGTTTAVTPSPMDSGDPAATFTAGSNASAEPTYTSNTTMDDTSVNPRSIYRWAPNDPSGYIVLPATASNGVGFFVNALGGATTIVADAKVLN